MWVVSKGGISRADARELSCLCLIITFADARASPNPKLWKRFPTLLVFINQTKCFRSAYDAQKSCLMKLSLWEIKILHRLSVSVWKSVIRFRGMNEKGRDVEG